MRKLRILFDHVPAGILCEEEGRYIFEYLPDYQGPSISRTLPREKLRFEFQEFPAFFDGLLPEGDNLEIFLKKTKIDRRDYFGQLLTMGQDLVGAITAEEWNE